MTSQNSEFTLEELLTVNLSKELKDEESGFVGIGTSGPAFILAVGIPIAAVRLAMYSHAPNFVLMHGPNIDPNLDYIPRAMTGIDLVKWKTKSKITMEDSIDIVKSGRLDVAFDSAGQVDKHGNLNIVCIGDYYKPKVRLVGYLAQTEHGVYAKRTIIMMMHEKRRFVEKVDVISCVGHFNGESSRSEIGLPGGGPSKVFTDLAVLSFDTPNKVMKLESVHPGVSVKQVQDNTGFDLVIPYEVPQTPIPTEEELNLIREKVDPEGLLLQGRMGGFPPATIRN